MSIDLVQQLSAWLVDTDIGLLELRGPDRQVQLRLRNDGGGAAIRQESVAAPSASARPPTSVMNSPSVGVFLHRHPMRESALAPAGTRVREGQPLGLLQVGALLLPVCAQQAGTVTGLRVAHGTVVGYGTPLIDLEPH